MERVVQVSEIIELIADSLVGIRMLPLKTIFYQRKGSTNISVDEVSQLYIRNKDWGSSYHL